VKEPIFLYKLRTLDSLNKYKELENTELYFAHFEELNDPMEGFVDFVWKGDRILWTNLFNHYIIQLEEAVFSVLIAPKDDKSNDKRAIRMRKMFNNLETDSLKDIVKSIQNMFLSYHGVQDTIDYLTKPEREVKRTELIEIFYQIHFIALYAVFTVFNKNRFVKDNLIDNIPSFPCSIINQYKNIATSWDKDATEKIAEIVNLGMEENSLMIQYNNYCKGDLYKNNTLFLDLPILFVNELVKLIYFPTYVASFSLDCTNIALWTHYAENHKGYCLKFKTQKQDNDSLRFPSTPTLPAIDKVSYDNQYPRIDFFQSLGTLPISEILTSWFKYNNKDSKYINCVPKNKTEEKIWIDAYRESWKNNYLTKLPAWESEQEYRMLLGDALFTSFSSEDARKLKYKFDDLDGIIFGYKMEMEHKLKIISIIEKLCYSNNRKDFKFYKTEPTSSGTMKIIELGLLSEFDDNDKNTMNVGESNQ